MRRVETFEITGSQDRREFETLANKPGITVKECRDFFAVSETDDGVIPVVTRVVDYEEAEAAPVVYTPPVC